MKLPSHQRALNDIELRYLKKQRAAAVRLYSSIPRRVAISSVVVCAALAVVTLFAERNHPGIVITFWTVVALIIGVPNALRERRKFSRRIAKYDHALSVGTCAERRFVSKRLWEFEEQEDEGACYAFELTSGGVVFVVGQDYYSHSRFPNADFSLVQFFGPDGDVIDMMNIKRGSKLDAERVITANEKAGLETPEHAEFFEGTLEQVYANLRRT